jgi:hypothetical protein
MSLRVLAALALWGLLSGCSSSAESSAQPVAGSSSGSPGAPAPAGAGVAFAEPDLQQIPHGWRRLPWAGAGVAELAPQADAVLPSVLGHPGPPARLAYHPLERWDGALGWSTERVLFLGRDGRWRGLDLADLGLPDAWWPGNDTFGPGSLSADGGSWAAHTNAGVVLVDLRRGTFRHVAFPATSPMVRHVGWDPGAHAFSAYARKPNGLRYTTFQVGTGGRLTRASYDGSRTRFDTDGTPVEVRTDGRTLTATRWEDTGKRSTSWTLPVRFRRATHFAAFGRDDFALIQTDPADGPIATLWIFDKRTGRPVARLRVPSASSLDGWTDDGTLAVYVDNRRLVTWDPRTGRFGRLLEVPGPYPQPGEWAASTVVLPGR